MDNPPYTLQIVAELRKMNVELLELRKQVIKLRAFHLKDNRDLADIDDDPDFDFLLSE